MERTQIYLPLALRDALDARARATGRTRSDLIREALERVYSDDAERRRAALPEAVVRAAGAWSERTEDGEQGVEALVAEVAALAGETKTEAVRQALLARRARLQLGASGPDAFFEYLEREVWPALGPNERARRLSREEEDELLGYGTEGV